jgi:hypothetical protein
MGNSFLIFLNAQLSVAPEPGLRTLRINLDTFQDNIRPSETTGIETDNIQDALA